MEMPCFEAALRDVNSSDGEFRWIAAQALGLAADDDVGLAVAALVTLVADPVAKVRAQAIVSLGALHDNGATIPELDLLALLNDSDLEVVCTAVESLYFLSPSPLEDAISRCCDANAAIRLSAVRALAALRFELDEASQQRRIRQMLLARLDDEDGVVALAAALELEEAGGERARFLLEQAVLSRQTEAFASVLALKSFPQGGNDHFFEASVPLWGGGSDLGVAIMALAARSDWGEALTRLRKLLNSFFTSRVLRALGVLQVVPVSAITEEIGALALKKSGSVAASAVEVLGSWVGRNEPQALTVLKQVACNGTGEVRERAVELLELEEAKRWVV